MIPRGDEERGGEDEGEESEGCGIEDTKEWDASAFYMHAGNTRRIVLINIILWWNVERMAVVGYLS